METCWLITLDPCSLARQNNLALANHHLLQIWIFLSVPVANLPAQLRQGNKGPHKGVLFLFLFLLLFLLGPTTPPYTRPYSSDNISIP